MTILVAVLEGKNESVDFLTVKSFETEEAANRFVDYTNANYARNKKNWSYAEIVRDGETIELDRPEE